MKITHIYALCAVLLLALGSRMADAVTVPDLFVARVPVADQSDTERERGFRAGLGQVAVKLTGQRGVLGAPGIAELVATAPRLVERYNYEEVPVAGSEPDAVDTPGFLLQVSFYAPAVDAALRRLHLPLWPAQRPSLLLLASGSEEDSAAMIEIARRVLANRGVPVLEPLWDLQDRRAIGATAGGFNADRIAAVARRYDANRWLALDPVGASDHHEGRWRLGGGDALLSGTSTADSLVHWVEESVGDAVDKMAAGLAYQPQTGSATQALVIENMRSYSAYRGVLEMLGAMEFIRGVEVTEMAADRLSLELKLDGNPDLLWAALDSNPHVSAVATAVAAEAAAQLSAEPATQPTADLPAQPDPGGPVVAAGDEHHYRWREL